MISIYLYQYEKVGKNTLTNTKVFEILVSLVLFGSEMSSIFLPNFVSDPKSQHQSFCHIHIAKKMSFNLIPNFSMLS